MKKTKRLRTAVIAAVLVFTMALGGCGTEAAETEVTEEESAVTVSTESVETGTITLTNSFIGTISPEETVMVIPLAMGTVTETFFEVGDTVEAGDVLFKMDDEAARLGLKQAQLSVESTKNQADSTLHNLYNQQDSTDIQMESSQLQSKSSFEQAQIGYFTAKNAYESADKAYSDAKKQLDAAKAALQSAGSNTNNNTNTDATDGVSGNNMSKAGQGTMPAGGNSGTNLAELESALTNLKSIRDQAYQAYLTASSGYRTAQDAQDITEETVAMTNDQLAATIEDTEASLKTGLSLAELGVAQAQMALDNYTVISPVSGVIESKGVEVNGIASQSSPAYTIVNNNTMTVTFQVSEDVKNTFSVGQNITLERNNDTYTASITEIGASVNPQSGLFQIKACVAANGSELPSGVSVKVSADTYRAENTMIIPYDAVYYENEGAYVYTSVNGRAVKTPITTGIFDDENIVVTGGLNLGDIVVTSWSPQLTDGVLLRALAEETQTDTKNSEAE